MKATPSLRLTMYEHTADQETTTTTTQGDTMLTHTTVTSNSDTVMTHSDRQMVTAGNSDTVMTHRVVPTSNSDTMPQKNIDISDGNMIGLQARKGCQEKH